MNERRPIVRKSERESPRDRRTVRTERALVGALIELVGEKRYAAITVQDLLDRADVGRSTFYSHYRGKDDLLLRSFADMLSMLDRRLDREPRESGRVAPVRELFAHVAASRPFHRAMKRANLLDRLYQAGTERLSSTIERRLQAHPEAGPRVAGVPRAVAARALAGAIFTLLKWWLEQEPPYSPADMDAMVSALAGRAG